GHHAAAYRSHVSPARIGCQDDLCRHVRARRAGARDGPRMSVASGRWRGGLVLPLLLVLVGVTILLGNVGAISWDRLDRLADLWPLLLVALGVRLVAGSLAPRAAPIVTLVVILAAGVAA